MRHNVNFDVEGLLAEDHAHAMHPWHDFRKREHTLLVGSDGIHVLDGAGNRYIDGIGGMWAVQLGYGNEELADAIADQIRRMAYYSPWSMTTPPHAALSAKLATLTPGDLNRFIYSPGGSEANESAVRFIHYYWNVMGEPQRKHVITRQDAYHGSTYLSASLCGKPGNDTRMELITDWIHHLSSPNPYRKPEGIDDDAFLPHLVEEFENKLEEIGPDRVAAFIAEPVLASGGVVVPPRGYQKAMLEVCRRHGVLMISDEVVTGFGRMGHFFASEPVFDIRPDIITAAKGFTSGYIPAGMTAVSNRLHDEIAEKGGEETVFSHGFTYSGHPAAMAGALKNIEIMERDDIMAHAREAGEHMQRRLRSLAELPLVGDVRGIGLMGCVEAVSSKKTRTPFDGKLEVGKRIDRRCQDLGLILRPMWHLCVFSPPIIITRDQIDEMVAIMERAIGDVADDLVREGLWDGKD